MNFDLYVQSAYSTYRIALDLFQPTATPDQVETIAKLGPKMSETLTNPESNLEYTIPELDVLSDALFFAAQTSKSDPSPTAFETFRNLHDEIAEWFNHSLCNHCRNAEGNPEIGTDPWGGQYCSKACFNAASLVLVGADY